MSDYLSLMMFPALLVALFLGFPVAFSMMGVALLFGLVVFGDAVIFQFVQKVNDVASNFVLAAVPLFVFMGAMLERSGIAERLFEAVHLWTPAAARRTRRRYHRDVRHFRRFYRGDRRHRNRGRLARHPGDDEVRLRPRPDLRHDLRRRLARHHHPALGGGGDPRPGRRRLGGRPLRRHDLPRPADGRALRGLHPGAVHARPRRRAAPAARRRRAGPARETAHHRRRPGAAQS